MIFKIIVTHLNKCYAFFYELFVALVLTEEENTVELEEVERTIKIRTVGRHSYSKTSRLEALFYKSDTGSNKTYKNIFDLLSEYAGNSEDAEEPTMLVPLSELDPDIVVNMCKVLYRKRTTGKVIVYAESISAKKTKELGYRPNRHREG